VSRHFLGISTTPTEDLTSIYRLAMKNYDGTELAQRGVSLIFEKPSLRTKASSLCAIEQLGGRVAVFTQAEIGLDVRESAEDVARTLAATSSIIAARVFDHSKFERMISATGDRVSYVNLLSDYSHPAQAIADVLALAEHFTKGKVKDLKGLTLAYVGDATNVTRSLASALTRLGAHVRVGAPNEYQLSSYDVTLINTLAEHGGTLSLFSTAEKAVEGADAIYTDSWISMGFEAEAEVRRSHLAAFQVNRQLLDLAKPGVAILHCLPAHRGEEISDEVLDNENSLIWSQVHHRTTAMRGILRWIVGKK
jgi:ornithine carbamoyltransferase